MALTRDAPRFPRALRSKHYCPSLIRAAESTHFRIRRFGRATYDQAHPNESPAQLNTLKQRFDLDFEAWADLRSATDFATIAVRMKPIIKISVVTLLAARSVIAQAPAGQAQAKVPAPGKSPASLPPPQTVTPQTYPVEQIQAGEGRFTSQCGFCHGRDAAGGETGPDLTRSALVAQDTRGDKIGPLLNAGRPDRGMPSFELTAADVDALVAFIHAQKTKFEALGGGRRAVDAADLADRKSRRRPTLFQS